MAGIATTIRRHVKLDLWRHKELAPCGKQEVETMSEGRGVGPRGDVPRRDEMRTPDEVAAMLRLKALGRGIKRIARELGCSHMTVRRYVAEGGYVAYRRRGRPRTLAGLDDWLAERFRRHAGNADVVRQELLAEKGIALSLRTIEREVAPLRRELASEALATIRFETPPGHQLQIEDRKSTRLNSSHTVISYAVFCLKKKKKNKTQYFPKKTKKKKKDKNL